MHRKKGGNSSFEVLNNVVSFGQDFHLGVGLVPSVSLRAGIGAGASAAPLVPKVTVWVGSNARGAAVLAASFSPESRVGVRVLVAVDIQWRDNDDVKVAEQVLYGVVIGLVLVHQLLRKVGHSGRTDPLSGVDAPLNPDDLLARTSAVDADANCHNIAFFRRFANGQLGGDRRVLGNQSIDQGNMSVVALVSFPEIRNGVCLVINSSTS